MTDYTKLSDDEINRMVAEAIEPEPPGGEEMDAGKYYPAWEVDVAYLDRWSPREFCTDPAAWGWLLETRHLGLAWNGELWGATTNEMPFVCVDAKPGRAVAIAYLESKGER